MGVVYGTWLEWFLHKYVLHRLLLKFKIKFHSDHHGAVVKNDGRDPEYDIPVWTMPFRLNEIWFVCLVGLIHFPLAWVSVWFYVGNWIAIALYIVIHIASHKYPKLGWRWMPWHMQHHLVASNKNYGVITPFWDWVHGTLYVVYNKNMEKN